MRDADPTPQAADSRRRIAEIQRPHRRLLVAYLCSSLLTGPLFPIFFLPRYFRFRTLRYRFEDDGISMRWGVLFRREIHLTYARIQDIHLRSGVIERWLGLARVLIQTASGSAGAEMTIEGVLEFEALRDFIYERMRGAGRDGDRRQSVASRPDAVAGGDDAELASVLAAVADELRAIREALERPRR